MSGWSWYTNLQWRVGRFLLFEVQVRAKEGVGEDELVRPMEEASWMGQPPATGAGVSAVLPRGGQGADGGSLRRRRPLSRKRPLAINTNLSASWLPTRGGASAHTRHLSVHSF